MAVGVALGTRARGALLAMLALGFVAGAVATQADETAGTRTLAGQLLVATRDMPDPRFARSVIYIVRHDAGGAMGVIVNRTLGEAPLADVLAQSGVRAPGATGTIRVRYGGPVAPTTGGALHSTDWHGDGTIDVGGAIAFTESTDVLQAVADGHGPRRMLLALGSAQWAPGQLEAEIAAHAWITVPADEGLIFDDNDDVKWERALAREIIRL